MGERERILLTEDSESLRIVVARRLGQAGHEVIFQAGDFETAIEGTKQAKEMGVTVAVLDGNLSADDISCSDGLEVAAALRKQVPEVKIVAYTSEPKRAGYGDVFVDKSSLDSIEQLVQTVTALEHPARP